MSAIPPLSGDEQTSGERTATAAFDPKATLERPGQSRASGHLSKYPLMIRLCGSAERRKTRLQWKPKRQLCDGNGV